MPEHTARDHEVVTAFADAVEKIPFDNLDVAEIEGGLTWRQTIVLGYTQSYLRIPGDELITQPPNARFVIRRSVDSALTAHVAKNGVHDSAKDAVVFCLEVAANEFEKLCETAPEWSVDKRIVEDLLVLWRDENEPYITEALASNVLFFMYDHDPTLN